MPWGMNRLSWGELPTACRGEKSFSPTGFINRAGGRLDSRRRTAAAVLGPLPPNRRRPGADPGPLAGFLSVRACSGALA